jgi:transcriptional regulator with XRE-family HTH domain
MTYRRLSQAIRTATTDAELVGVSAHVLRHTFASILIYQGRDVAFVARQLGHTTPSTTWDTYVHLFNAAKQADEAREQLDAEFGSVLDDPRAPLSAAGRVTGDIPATAADRVGALRSRAGLTAREIATLIGATKQTLSRWETGKGEPQPRLDQRLSALEALVEQLAASRVAYEVHDWLFTSHPRLEDDRPVDRIRRGATDDVAALLGPLSSGAAR